MNNHTGNNTIGKKCKPKSGDPPLAGQAQSINRTRLLNRVVSFYHQSFCEDQRGQEYLQSVGISDNSIFVDFQIGFSNGTLLNTIPDDGDVTEGLKEIGILNARGHERFYGCVVFPIFDENKDCVGIYGHRIGKGQAADLYLPGPRRGVWNWQAAQRSRSIILTESIIDALTLYSAGFKSVIPCYGGNGLIEDHLALFARYQTKEVYLCFNCGGGKKRGMAVIYAQLKKKGIDTYIANLPATASPEQSDINSFFLRHADALTLFGGLLREVNPLVSIRSDRVLKQEYLRHENTESGFVVQYEDRRYEVRSIVKDKGRLKATVKALAGVGVSELPEGIKQRFHLDTIDLYSNRSRTFFAKACALLFPKDEALFTDDITRLIGLSESWQPQVQSKTPVRMMTRNEEEEALDFLRDPLLFDRILQDFETMGLTGEDGNKLMGYISATSRKLDEPLSVIVQSRSAAGKSTLQDAIIMLIPAEDYIKYTRLTGQALFYKEESSLVHKLIAIEEEHGARDASYSIRNIQSSKYLSIATTSRDPVTGKLKTEEYRVKGPVAPMITTTEVELDYETSNRFITLTIDESKEMTERILQKQREQETLEGLIGKTEAERIAMLHHNAQRLLKPFPVINPYARHLTFPSESLRCRRDHKKYLGLLKAIAFIHQYQREIKTVNDHGEVIHYIEVTLEDIEKGNRLAGEVLGRTLDELSPPSRLLLKMIAEMVRARCNELKIMPHDYRFSRRDIRDWSKWSDFQIKSHVRQLEDLEYLYSITGKKGKQYIYELLYPGGGEDGRPFLMGLIDIEQLRIKASNIHKL